MNLTKKYGPLPLWAWGAVGIVAIYLYYRYSQSGSSSTTSQSAAAVNNGIDPVTGVPYASEQAAYQNEAASALAPGSGGGSGGSNGGSTTDPNQEIADVIGWITGLQTAGLIPTPTNSDGTTAHTTNASTPATKPQVNGRVSTGPLLNVKAIRAPFGHNPPPAKAGYTAVGTGAGNWQYVPNDIVNAAHGYLFGAVSHHAPTAPKGYVAKGLGHGLWEFSPKPKTGSRH